MEYTKIINSNDIENLMKKFDYFHDSCIKEIKYCSGGYVGEDRGMYPFNAERCVTIIFQRQSEEMPTIEMKFNYIEKLNLHPRNEDYDCIIYGASILKHNDMFYWSEWEDFKIEDIQKEDGTWISASEIYWRPLENALGDEKIYINNKDIE